MSSLEKQARYVSLEDQSLEEQDLGHESDTTACSDGFLGKKGGSGGEKRLSRAKRTEMMLTWVRWGTVVSLQLLIVMLLFWRLPSASDEMGSEEYGTASVETGGDINGLFKTCKNTIYPHFQKHRVSSKSLICNLQCHIKSRHSRPNRISICQI